MPPPATSLQPSEVIYNRPVLVERGSFRPVTHVNVDMLNCATAQFLQEPMVKGKDVVVIMEITMNNLLAEGALDADDFLSRVDMLGHIGFTVLISNYSEFYRLVSYFRRYTKEMIGVAMGINTLLEIFNEKYYDNLEGGILESMGRMFRHAVKLYIYPMQQAAYDSYLMSGRQPGEMGPVPHAFASNVLITARNLHVADHLRNLYAHLLENHYIDCLPASTRTTSASFPATCCSGSRTPILLGTAGARQGRRSHQAPRPARLRQIAQADLRCDRLISGGPVSRRAANGGQCKAWTGSGAQAWTVRRPSLQWILRFAQNDNPGLMILPSSLRQKRTGAVFPNASGPASKDPSLSLKIFVCFACFAG